jgi:hypothetical protein
MKLLTLLLFFSLIVAVLGTSAAAQHQAAPTRAVRSREIVLKEFYKWYIHSINRYQKATAPFEGAMATLKKYAAPPSAVREALRQSLRLVTLL